ncbi:hypothetical protein GJAV_G00143060 [Gymnothorax javanicus]|nr:hypothetical protein GJAV_G00143060 [Gymnothorax javanicus]
MDLLSQNPCQVTEVSSSEYSSEDKDRLREEGGLALYWNLSRKSWDYVLQCPETPAVALRLFQAPSEEDAQNWFLKLYPLLELARPQFNTKTLQTIMDCLKNHPDWSWAHIAVETGIRYCLMHNCVLRSGPKEAGGSGCRTGVSTEQDVNVGRWD